MQRLKKEAPIATLILRWSHAYRGSWYPPFRRSPLCSPLDHEEPRDRVQCLGVFSQAKPRGFFAIQGFSLTLSRWLRGFESLWGRKVNRQHSCHSPLVSPPGASGGCRKANAAFTATRFSSCWIVE